MVHLRGLLNDGGGVDGHATGGGDDLEGAVLGELANQAARQGATDLVLLNESVEGDVAGLLGGRANGGVVERLGEDDTVVLLLAELGLL